MSAEARDANHSKTATLLAEWKEHGAAGLTEEATDELLYGLSQFVGLIADADDADLGERAAWIVEAANEIVGDQ